jgi:ribosomal-protein-alanine N-acetyltransferase
MPHEAPVSPDTQVRLTCQVGGIVTAWCEFLAGVDDAEILNIETLPSYRRQGQAANLLGQVKTWAQLNHRAGIWLEVRVSNAPAIALYQQGGFQKVHTRQAYYADGEDALVMKYTL